MTTARYGVAEVRAVLDQLVDDNPDRQDRRAAGNLAPRYTEHGSPACLVAAVLHRLGFSLGTLKALDHEAGRRGGGVQLQNTTSPIRRRFTPDAWELLAFLQRRNDRSLTWKQARADAFRIDPYWANANPKFAFPGPWCTPENAIKDAT